MKHIIRVHQPTLSDRERAERLERIKRAAADLIRAAERKRTT